MDKRSVRKVLSVLLTSIMLITSIPAVWAAGEEKSEENGDKYKQGEVIVMFADGAVEESGDSLKKARAIPEVSFSQSRERTQAQRHKRKSQVMEVFEQKGMHC